MTIDLGYYFNRNNLRIIGVSERQEEKLSEEATVKIIFAEKFPELKSKCTHTLDA